VRWGIFDPDISGHRGNGALNCVVQMNSPDFHPVNGQIV
jgi:hypothetical protein